jgi:ABC-type lipoprotein export system ATPase subunit
VNPLIALHNVSRFSNGHSILCDVSLSVVQGESCAIVGASGSGKSTLLNVIGLLDQPCRGRLLIDGSNMANADAETRAITRNHVLGFVFQSFNLLPRLSALDNVALPLSYRGVSKAAARERAGAELRRVGLASRARYLPADMSGGQRQRVAIARALVTGPRILLADEPTGNLDGDSAQDIVELLLSLNRKQGMTLLMVTHDPTFATFMERRLLVREGRVFDV